MGHDVTERCSIEKEMTVEPAGHREVELLQRYHYCGGRIAVYTHAFALIHFRRRRELAGVIVYTMPTLALRLRSKGLPGMFAGLSRLEKCRALNRNVRRIARVIIDPRYRGAGLAAGLVRRTMPMVGVQVVEALATMGRVCPFFERAGMKRFDGAAPEWHARFQRILESAGISEDLLIDPRQVHRIIEGLPAGKRALIDAEMARFLKPCGRIRYMPHGLERTRCVLSRLCARPVYYLWQRAWSQNAPRTTAGDIQGDFTPRREALV